MKLKFHLHPIAIFSLAMIFVVFSIVVLDGIIDEMGTTKLPRKVSNLIEYSIQSEIVHGAKIRQDLDSLIAVIQEADPSSKEYLTLKFQLQVLLAEYVSMYCPPPIRSLDEIRKAIIQQSLNLLRNHRDNGCYDDFSQINDVLHKR
ncbi:hypothetical protein ACFL6I_26635 [candidate division KSB1 bacterium]